jgi:hypothetical protein
MEAVILNHQRSLTLLRDHDLIAQIAALVRG